MTAVIYARYSSDNQREESIEGQIRFWRAMQNTTLPTLPKRLSVDRQRTS